MNLSKALKILKQQGFRIKYENGKYYQEYEFRYRTIKDFLSPREIIRWARQYTSDSKFNTAKKRGVKESRHRKNRIKTKEDIHHQRYDNFGKGLRNDSNLWDFD